MSTRKLSKIVNVRQHKAVMSITVNNMSANVVIANSELSLVFSRYQFGYAI